MVVPTFVPTTTEKQSEALFRSDYYFPSLQFPMTRTSTTIQQNYSERIHQRLYYLLGRFQQSRAATNCLPYEKYRRQHR